MFILLGHISYLSRRLPSLKLNGYLQNVVEVSKLKRAAASRCIGRMANLKLSQAFSVWRGRQAHSRLLKDRLAPVVARWRCALLAAAFQGFLEEVLLLSHPSGISTCLICCRNSKCVFVLSTTPSNESSNWVSSFPLPSLLNPQADTYPLIRI